MLKKEMATHSSILAWRILWTEEPGGLQSMGSSVVKHDLATKSTPPPCQKTKPQRQRATQQISKMLLVGWAAPQRTMSFLISWVKKVRGGYKRAEGILDGPWYTSQNYTSVVSSRVWMGTLGLRICLAALVIQCF